jgi:hypothetical protein
MCAEIVNLRQFRKDKARSDKERQAEANRLQHGRTKAEKTLTRALNDKADKALDQGRLEKRLEERKSDNPGSDES